LIRDSSTTNKKWNIIMTTPTKFQIAEQKDLSVTVDDSLYFFEGRFTEYLDKLEEAKLEKGIEMIQDVVKHLGNITLKLQNGQQVFLNKNFSAQRIKKLAFRQQAEKNVQLRDGEIDFVKKQYKGNWETLKKHKDLKVYLEHNKTQPFDAASPIDQKIKSVLDLKSQTKLRYLKLEKTAQGENDDSAEEIFVNYPTVTYELGCYNRIRTDFCLLKGSDAGKETEDPAAEDDMLLVTFGYGVVCFDDIAGEFNLQEVRQQVEEKMLAEQNGICSEAVSQMQEKLRELAMFTKFIS